MKHICRHEFYSLISSIYDGWSVEVNTDFSNLGKINTLFENLDLRIPTDVSFSDWMKYIDILEIKKCRQELKLLTKKATLSSLSEIQNEAVKLKESYNRYLKVSKAIDKISINLFTFLPSVFITYDMYYNKSIPFGAGMFAPLLSKYLISTYNNIESSPVFAQMKVGLESILSGSSPSTVKLFKIYGMLQKP